MKSPKQQFCRVSFTAAAEYCITVSSVNFPESEYTAPGSFYLSLFEKNRLDPWSEYEWHFRKYRHWLDPVSFKQPSSIALFNRFLFFIILLLYEDYTALSENMCKLFKKTKKVAEKNFKIQLLPDAAVQSLLFRR